MKKTITLSLLSSLLLSNLSANPILLDPLTVESERLENNEFNAPADVEIYTSEDISKAHVQTLPEFLQKNSSVNIRSIS